MKPQRYLTTMLPAAFALSACCGMPPKPMPDAHGGSNAPATSTSTFPDRPVPFPHKPTPEPEPEPEPPVIDHDDHSEDPNRDPEAYERWKETGVWEE